MLEFQELEQECQKKAATRLTKVNCEEMKASAGKNGPIPSVLEYLFTMSIKAIWILELISIVKSDDWHRPILSINI